MARIPVIVSTQDPRAGAPSSRASGQQFGADVGAAMQGLGNTIAQVGAEFGSIGAERQARADRIAVATADGVTSYAGPYNEIVTKYPDPSGEGLTQTVQEHGAAWIDQVVADSGLTGRAADELRLRKLAEVQAYTNHAVTDQANMALGHANVMAQAGLDTAINDVRANGAVAPGPYGVALNKGFQLIDAQPGTDAVAKEKGKAWFRSQMATARFAALADGATTPQAIEALQKELASPEWENQFDSPAYAQVSNLLDATHKSIVEGTRAAVNAKLESLTDRANAGVPIPAAEMNEAFELASSAGNTMTNAQRDKLHNIVVQNDAAVFLAGKSKAEAEAYRANGFPGGAPGVTSPTGYKLVYANTGIRDQPINGRLATVYEQAAAASGVTEVRVISGGQPSSGPNRTGSHRHDDGNAGDIQLLQNGRVLDFTKPGDQAIVVKFLQTSYMLGAGGIGAGIDYMGPNTLHVGFGSAATWGAHGSSANAPAWLKNALNGVTRGATPGPTGSINPTLQTLGPRYNVRPALLDGMWFAESTRGVNMRSPKGAQGHFGFMPDTWGEYGKGGDPNNFEQSADAAARYMNDLLKQFHGNEKLALMAYNWGPGSVRQWLKDGSNPAEVPGETTEYVNKVMTAGGDGSGSTGPYTYSGGVTQTQFVFDKAVNNFINDQQTRLASNSMDYATAVDGGNIPMPDILTGGPEAWSKLADTFSYVNEKYQVPPDQAKAFTTEAATVIDNVMASGDSAKIENILGMIAATNNREFINAANKQIGQKNDVMGQAGYSAAAGDHQTAFSIIEGNKLLKDATGKTAPWIKEANNAWAEKQAAFAAVDAGRMHGIKGAIDSVYAYNTRMKGGDFDPDAYNAAIEQVTGQKLAVVNDVAVLLPKYIDGDALEAAIQAPMQPDEWAAISETGSLPYDRNGDVLEPWALKNVQLFIENDDTHSYRVFVTDGYAITADGRPFRVVLNETNADTVKDIAAEAVTPSEPPPTPAQPGNTMFPSPAPLEPGRQEYPFTAPAEPPASKPSAPLAIPEPVPPLRPRAVPSSTQDQAMRKQQAQIRYEGMRQVYINAINESDIPAATKRQFIKEWEAANKPK